MRMSQFHLSYLLMSLILILEIYGYGGGFVLFWVLNLNEKKNHNFSMNATLSFQHIFSSDNIAALQYCIVFLFFLLVEFQMIVLCKWPEMNEVPPQTLTYTNRP